MKALSISFITVSVFLLISILTKPKMDSISLHVRKNTAAPSQLVPELNPQDAAEPQPALGQGALPVSALPAYEIYNPEDAALVKAAADTAAAPEGQLPTVVAGVAASASDPAAAPDAGLEAFTAAVATGDANTVTGVYVQDVLALPVIQQPAGQAGYVSEDFGVATQFGLPSAHGTVGLLAHNFLSGQDFFKLQQGQTAVVLYGDGTRSLYRISSVQRFQALSPHSMYSDFVDIDDPNHGVISANNLFNHVYTTPDTLVFQTCIEAEGNSSWGRLFVTAEIID